MNDFFLDIHQHFIDADRIPYAIVAILLAMVLGLVSGPLAGHAGPFTWFLVHKTIGSLGDRLDKKHRAKADLMFRGFIVVAVALFLALGLSVLIENLAVEVPFYGVVEVFLLTMMISAGTVWLVLYRLYVAIEKKQVGKGAYYAIAQSSRRNLSIADDFGITRTGMALSARMFDKGLVNPVFWYLVGGLPLALIYSFISALAWRFGKDGFTKGFGSTALALERLMGFVPSILSAFIITLATVFTPGAAIHKGVAAWWGHKNRATYEQGGFPLSALAWSLNVSLGGASQDLSGSAIKAEWVGPESATAKVSHQHLKRTLYISVMAHLLFLVSLGGAYLWSGSLF